MEEKLYIEDDFGKQGEWKSYKTNTKNLIICYIDVGNLAPMACEAFMEKIKLSNQAAHERLADSCVFMYIPLRPNSATRVEAIQL